MHHLKHNTNGELAVLHQYPKNDFSPSKSLCSSLVLEALQVTRGLKGNLVLQSQIAQSPIRLPSFALLNIKIENT